MAIGRPQAIDAAPAPQAGAQRRMAAARLSCFARNGRSPREESRSAPLRHRRSRRSRPAARSAHRRGRVERSISREDQGEPGDSIVQPRGTAASARGAHPASRRPAASMLPMSRDRPAISPLPSRAWRFVARANPAIERCPRRWAQRDPALIHSQFANRR